MQSSSLVSIRPKQAKIMTIPSTTIFCQRLLTEVLSTHEALNDEDIVFAVDLGCQAQGLTNIQILGNFVTHSCQLTNTGRFSLSFNYALDQAIKSRNGDRFIALATSPSQNIWLEVYDNAELTSDERKIILDMYNRELVVFLNILEQGSTEAGSLVLPCDRIKECHPTDINNQGKTCLYSNCYRDVCLAESKVFQIPESGRLALPDQSDQIPGTVMVPDIREGFLRVVHCFDFITLIRSLSTVPIINPITEKPFSPEGLRLLLSRYEKEIKMYRRYLNGLAVLNI